MRIYKKKMVLFIIMLLLLGGFVWGILYLKSVADYKKAVKIFQQLSAFKRRCGIGKYYQQRHTQKKRKDNDSVAFGTAYNIVFGKESRPAKPRFSKAHNALFAEAFPCLPVSYSIDRGHFAHPARAAETEQENDSRYQNCADHVDKNGISFIDNNRICRQAHEHFAKRIAEH